MIKKIFLILLCYFISSISMSDNRLPLPADQAFQFSFRKVANGVHLHWKIAKDYYLYKERLSFQINNTGLKIGNINFPKGLTKQNAKLKREEVYSKELNLVLDVQGKGTGVLSISYQGCKKQGFCYPPIKKNIPLYFNSSANLFNKVKDLTKEQHYTEQLLAGTYPLWLILLSFLGLGLLLAFTPCSLPMLPILSGIIVGHHKHRSLKKAFTLSSAYVAGMALTYSFIGMLIALIGHSIQATLETPLMIILMTSIFLFLAFSLFGFYKLQLPHALQNKVSSVSHRQKSGTYLGAFLMGALSTLIVAPCISAPLVGILGFIGQTGSILIGSLSLFTLGLGMGIPLLLVGISADRLLPKAGYWMQTIEHLFGFLMLGIAIWMLSRMLSHVITLFLWSLLFIALAIFLVFFMQQKKANLFAKITGFFALLSGVVIMLQMFFTISFVKLKPQNVLNPFTKIYNETELNKAFLLAKQQKKWMLIDFYAKWCSACQILQKEVFTQKEILSYLTPYLLLQIDITHNNSFNQNLLQQWHILGLPSILFFDKEQKEVKKARIVGEVSAQQFLKKLPQRIN